MRRALQTPGPLTYPLTDSAVDVSLISTAAACLLALLSAAAVSLARRPVYAVVALLLHSLSIATLFAILGAAFMAAAQLLIYSGAIVVLFLFVVTLLPAGGRELKPTRGRLVAGLIAAALLLVAIAAVLVAGTLPAASGGPTATTSVLQLGQTLFGPLLPAVELTAPLLLVAIIAVVAIWRRHEPATQLGHRAAATGERRLVMHP